ncbi:Fic family protein [Massilia violaceinigra]|uniref:Fic family protein n=1 Tax=Massilia violaceinigra TaxID=2045208 RepID=UPI001ABFDA0D|nr:Fic family protein [Massilia violaceinigra]
MGNKIILLVCRVRNSWRRLAHYYCELNVIHPFRNGNGRAQRLMFELIGINAGFEIRWEPIGRAEWADANIAAFYCRLDPADRSPRSYSHSHLSTAGARPHGVERAVRTSTAPEALRKEGVFDAQGGEWHAPSQLNRVARCDTC